MLIHPLGITKRGMQMRKVVAGLFMSLDGVVESPEQWGFTYMTEEMSDLITKGIAQADTILLGPSTYHKFARLWPPRGDDVPMAKFLNRSPKYVISYNPNAEGPLEWQPATLLRGNLSEEIPKLKAQPGKNIQVPGSPRLVRSLLCEGLLDELSLSICPVARGKGLRLFDELTKQINLEVVRSKMFSNGLISVTYRPIRANEKPSKQELDFPKAATQ